MPWPGRSAPQMFSGENELRAAATEFLSEGETEPARAAGDDDDLATGPVGFVARAVRDGTDNCGSQAEAEVGGVPKQ